MSGNHHFCLRYDGGRQDSPCTGRQEVRVPASGPIPLTPQPTKGRLRERCRQRGHRRVSSSFPYTPASVSGRLPQVGGVSSTTYYFPTVDRRVHGSLEGDGTDLVFPKVGTSDLPTSVLRRNPRQEGLEVGVETSDVRPTSLSRCLTPSFSDRHSDLCHTVPGCAPKISSDGF